VLGEAGSSESTPVLTSTCSVGKLRSTIFGAFALLPEPPHPATSVSASMSAASKTAVPVRATTASPDLLPGRVETSDSPL